MKLSLSSVMFLAVTACSEPGDEVKDASTDAPVRPAPPADLTPWPFHTPPCSRRERLTIDGGHYFDVPLPCVPVNPSRDLGDPLP